MRSRGAVSRIVQALLICGLLASVAVAQKAATVKGDSNINPLGSINNGTYRNEFLKFELKVPDQWIRFGSAEVQTAKQIGTDGIKSGDRDFDKAFAEAANREVVVLAMGKKPLGALGNSAIALGVFKQPSAHVTPKMVSEAAKSLIISNPSNKLVRDVENEMIGGKQFAVFDTEIAANGAMIPLRYYATMVRGYSLTVTMTAADEASLKVMEAAFRTIKFQP